MIKKRTEIIVKTHRLLVVNRQNSKFVARCEKCGEMVEMVMPDEAAAIVEISSRDIYRAIEANGIDFIETPQVYVCCNSLDAFFNR